VGAVVRVPLVVGGGVAPTPPTPTAPPMRSVTPGEVPFEAPPPVGAPPAVAVGPAPAGVATPPPGTDAVPDGELPRAAPAALDGLVDADPVGPADATVDERAPGPFGCGRPVDGATATPAPLPEPTPPPDVPP
jgi:hypothetical protein